MVGTLQPYGWATVEVGVAVTIESGLRAGDLGQITAQHGRLYRSEYGLDERFEAYVAAGVAAAVLSAIGRPARFWIVRAGDVFCGSAAVCTAADGTAQFRWFLVEPGLRGRGLGRRLLEGALDHSRTVGYPRL